MSVLSSPKELKLWGITAHEPPESFQQYGIEVDSKILSILARAIAPPTLEFASGRPEDVIKKYNVKKGKNDVQKQYTMLGQWQLTPAVEFIDHNGAPSGRPFFLIPRKFQNSAVPDFLRSFWEHYTANGAPCMNVLPKQFHKSNSWARDGWRNDDFLTALESAARNKAGIVILILPRNDKLNQIQYANFKAVMHKRGMDSLCLCERKLQQNHDKLDPYSPTSDMANYAHNVGMKLNIRLGNTNHSLPANHFNILPKDAEGNYDTLVLGADVIHPGVSAIDGTPSIAALVGSVDGRYGKYLGSLRMQKYNKTARSTEVIDDTNMRAMARERLDAWKKESGRYPGNILYYRDGVGDSQFTQVLEKEVAMIREAYQISVKGTAQAKREVTITTVVVVKRHNVRLYPSASGETSNTGNCLPGTVVDSGITHPYNFDFFLISHEGLQGTVRPTHYIVLQNEMGFNATEIQDLTHNLCYTYQRSTTSVSYVPPTYYADHLCERGRCYLMDFYDGADAVKNTDAQQVENHAKQVWAKGGRANGNPWHPNMDDKMFWM